jgi:tetratricopeptide (TPR) repeat protein
MATAAETFHRASQCHQAGHFRQAEELYRHFLQTEHSNPEAWHLLGAACHGQGKVAEAAFAYRRSLELAPTSAETQYRLATALADLGQRPEAVEHFRQVLQSQPGHADALLGLGVALAEQGSLADAVASLKAAVHYRPDLARAHYNLGVALAQLNRPAEAADSLSQALRLQPGYAAPHYALGNLLAAQGKRAEAVASYRAAVRHKPDYAEAYNNLGLALIEERQLAEAVVLLRQGARLRPLAAEAHNNLGLALADLGRFAEAESCFHEALRLAPAYADAHNNLGSCYKEQGRLDEALACYELALLFQPEAASVHWNRALALLHQGDFERGWAEYEWRWRRAKARPRSFPQPAWDGADPAARTVLVWMEQGLGDMLQFVRYAELLKRRGATVLVECPAFLHPLLSRCRGIDRLLAEGETLPAFDAHVPLLSLPHRCRTTLADVPAEVPYLFADEGRVERWRQELAPLGGFRIGICWQGNRHHQWDHFRSFPVGQFAPLAALPGVRLVSLQKGPGAEQLKQLGGRFAVVGLDSEQDAATAALMDTAAVMKNLDLVITTDTAIAHLAGGLGVPVWVALAAVCDWRWLRGRNDSPWYPTMRLFRQTTLGDWDGVFRRMTAALKKKIKPRKTRKPRNKKSPPLDRE